MSLTLTEASLLGLWATLFALGLLWLAPEQAADAAEETV